ncbi:DUF2946 domain-containing protein [Paraburkholderia ferrariae]|uniref:DUF2946 domain-containing protein n=1 Tax=Paraburkholderia ferrariae TaxID=386056 RepID=UPI0005A936F4|nr:DUF2946 domain-containing protein [Paraburkholderia ferrariae]
MKQDGALFRRLTWLALFGLVFGCFAPAISGLLASAEAAPSAVICGAGGAVGTRVAVPQAETKRSPIPNPADGVRCGYCLLAYHWPALPTLAAAWVVPGAAGVSAAGAGFERGFTQPVHRYGRGSRAPPSSLFAIA